MSFEIDFDRVTPFRNNESEQLLKASQTMMRPKKHPSDPRIKTDEYCPGRLIYSRIRMNNAIQKQFQVKLPDNLRKKPDPTNKRGIDIARFPDVELN